MIEYCNNCKKQIPESDPSYVIEVNKNSENDSECILLDGEYCSIKCIINHLGDFVN